MFLFRNAHYTPSYRNSPRRNEEDRQNTRCETGIRLGRFCNTRSKPAGSAMFPHWLRPVSHSESRFLRGSVFRRTSSQKSTKWHISFPTANSAPHPSSKDAKLPEPQDYSSGHPTGNAYVRSEHRPTNQCLSAYRTESSKPKKRAPLRSSYQ